MREHSSNPTRILKCQDARYKQIRHDHKWSRPCPQSILQQRCRLLLWESPAVHGIHASGPCMRMSSTQVSCLDLFTHRRNRCCCRPRLRSCPPGVRFAMAHAVLRTVHDGHRMYSSASVRQDFVRAIASKLRGKPYHRACKGLHYFNRGLSFHDHILCLIMHSNHIRHERGISLIHVVGP